MLRIRDEHRIDLRAFLDLHKQVLRDTISAGWLILLDASDPNRLARWRALASISSKQLRALGLSNPDTGSIQRLLEALVTDAHKPATPDACACKGHSRWWRCLRLDRSIGGR
jgi:hypothetical protein